MKTNRKSLMFTCVFLVFLAVILLSSCENGQNKTLKEINILSTLKDTYYVGEELDFSLCEFSVTFVSGETKNVTMQDEHMYSNYSSIDNQEAGDCTVIFIYRESEKDAVYVNFEVHFINDDVTSLNIDSTSYASSVKQNDVLNLTGIRAQATYSSGKSETLNYANLTISSFSTQEVGRLDILVSYKGASEHIFVQVIAHSLVSCEAQGLISTYSVGSEISFANIRLRLNLDDGSSIDVWGSENVSYQTDVNSSVAGTYYVQFFYVGSTYVVEDEDNAKTQLIPIIVE